MKKTSQITKKLCKLATKLDELGMISEADRIDTISGLLAPGEAWSCPIELKEDPMDSFFNFLDFIKENAIVKNYQEKISQKRTQETSLLIGWKNSMKKQYKI